jgi:hypothetical protein
MPSDLAYPYRPPAGRLTLLVLLIGCLGIFNLTQGARRGGHIVDQIRFNLGTVTAFDFISGAMMLAAVILCLYRLLVTRLKRPELALGPSGIRLPVGLTMTETAIGYADIKSILYQNDRQREFLTITRQKDKQVVIAASMLPSKEAFMKIRAELSACAAAGQGL